MKARKSGNSSLWLTHIGRYDRTLGDNGSVQILKHFLFTYYLKKMGLAYPGKEVMS